MQQLENIKTVISETNFRELFINAFGKRKAKTMLNGNKANGYCYDVERYAVMFHEVENRIFILNYATPANNWAKIAMQQNENWKLLGFISAGDISENLEKHYLTECVNEEIYLIELIEHFENKY